MEKIEVKVEIRLCREKNESFIRLYPEDMKLEEYSLNAILRSQLRIKWRSGHLIFDPQKNHPWDSAEDWMEARLESESIKRALQWFEQEMRKCELMRCQWE